MTEEYDYDLVRDMIDRTVGRCEQFVSQLDGDDPYEGTLSLLLKHQVRDDLVNKCAVLILEECSEDDLRELFSDEVYEDAEKLFDEMTLKQLRRTHTLS